MELTQEQIAWKERREAREKEHARRKEIRRRWFEYAKEKLTLWHDMWMIRPDDKMYQREYEQARKRYINAWNKWADINGWVRDNYEEG